MVIELGEIVNPPVKPEKAQSVVEKRAKTKQEAEKAGDFVFSIPKIKSNDVIGMHRPKVLMHKLLELPLRKPEQFIEMGINKSIGIILYGPPGVGKTLLTQAVCGELNIDFCYVTISSVMSKFVGESAQNIHKLFAKAKDHQPCAIFFDEADALLQPRDEISSEGGSVELKQTVSQMLMETSIVHDDKASHVYMLAATNAPWKIDIAHKRSGRFEYLIYIRPPGLWDRRRLFMHYLHVDDVKGQKNFGNINYLLLAIATPNYSPADIEKVCKVAKINALEKDRVLVTTRSVQCALWSKEAGKSSLDEWYLVMATKYLPPKRSLIKMIISRTYRKRVKEKEDHPSAIFNSADMKIYQELIDDVRRYMKYRYLIALVRIFGKGLPRVR